MGAEVALDPETANHLLSAMLAHATWVLAKLGYKLNVVIEGRGIRVRDGKALDAFVTEFHEFDRVLDEWVGGRK